ncbi:MAG: squalene/phytoene synthase family protein [Planctomycetaceae bacterium]|jgi:phytoene/squalene synthetase|nr:squalene/phytoene synthase family protein [Planctomycetaceae bacterium]
MVKEIFSEIGGGLLLSEAFACCGRLARSHYENFSVVSFLLPKRLRVPMEVVYAYCRYSDDLGDANDGSESARVRAIELLDQWERRVDECFRYADGDLTSEQQYAQSIASEISAGSKSVLLPDLGYPICVALSDVVRQYKLPKEPFTNLLIAFRQDQTKRRYDTMEELVGYCCNSANPVGRIVLHLVYAVAGGCGGSGGSGGVAGADRVGEIEIEPRVLSLSDSICTGLQLANFWQDIARDWLMGRCYIPREVALRYGIDIDVDVNANIDADLVNAGARKLPFGETAEFKSMMRELVDDARKRLIAGVPLLDAVPKMIRFDISLFIRGGLAILNAIENINYCVLKKRPIVTKLDKIKIIINALLNRKF